MMEVNPSIAQSAIVYNLLGFYRRVNKSSKLRGNRRKMGDLRGNRSKMGDLNM